MHIRSTISINSTFDVITIIIIDLQKISNNEIYLISINDYNLPRKIQFLNLNRFV